MRAIPYLCNCQKVGAEIANAGHRRRSTSDEQRCFSFRCPRLSQLFQVQASWPLDSDNLNDSQPG